MNLSAIESILGESKTPRIETLLEELNLFSTFNETEAIATAIQVYRWIYHSNRGEYIPQTELSIETKDKFPELARELSRLSEIKSTWKVSASDIGRLGGLAKSSAKTLSSRENGKKGGRPKKDSISKGVNLSLIE